MVAVNAVDYAFEDLPETVEAGTMLSLTNNSTAEVHELVAFLLPEDETRPIEELVTAPGGGARCPVRQRRAGDGDHRPAGRGGVPGRR